MRSGDRDGQVTIEESHCALSADRIDVKPHHSIHLPFNSSVFSRLTNLLSTLLSHLLIFRTHSCITRLVKHLGTKLIPFPYNIVEEKKAKEIIIEPLTLELT
jgi:hypothetical protein